MRWCTGALAKLIFQLFCVWRSRGRRKGDPNINVVGTIKLRIFMDLVLIPSKSIKLDPKTIKFGPKTIKFG